MPWPTTGDNDLYCGNDYSGNTADLHTKTTSDAFARYLDLDHTRQSHSSDVTKVGSPPADVHLGSSSPFFVGHGDELQNKNAVGGQSGVAGEGVRAGTGMQTPPSSQPATKSHPHGSGGGGGGGGGDRDNTFGPWNETRNSEDLPAFDMDVDLNRKGGVGSSTATATAVATMSMVQPPSSPQPPSGTRVIPQVQPPPPSSRQSLPLPSPSFPLTGNAMPNQEVGPLGETKDPNRLPEFDDHVDSNRVGRDSSLNPSSPLINSSPSFSNNDINAGSGSKSGETTQQQHQQQQQQHQATPEHIMQSSSSSPLPPPPLARPPAGPVTLSSYSSTSSSSSSPIRSGTNTKNNTKGGVNNSNNNYNNNNITSINPRTTTTTSLSMVLPLDDSPVGPFGETRLHLPTSLAPSPPFSSPSSGAGGSSGLPLVAPLTKTKDVELIRTMSGQHHNQDQTNTTNTTPDPFQSSNSSSLWSSHHPAYDFESVYRESGNPFLSFSRQTSTGKEKGGRRGPLSPPSPSPRGEKSASSSESSSPWLLQQQHQPTSTNTNPFLPQWNMTSQQQQQQQQHQQQHHQLVVPDSRAHPLSSSLAVHFPYSQPNSQSLSQSQLQSQPRTRDQEQGSGAQQDNRGPFDETRSSRNNSIPSWFEQDVDLNKIGPDPSQVDEARKSVAEIERRTSAKKADQQRLASSLSPSVSASVSSGDQ
ncbi:MAG: hypothetical protein J3R72DRAFT_446779 [Linnemannia gamsii]|nr:MAG: hypothetical protein J3R72DRAFT_446779 [Linnemannia gamsii]